MDGNDALSGRRRAAVLVPVYDGPEGPTLLLIRRTNTINHPGQVAFPGGRPEPGDTGLLATALREVQEELGLDPASLRLLGELPVVETLSSNYAISAFVGRLRERPLLRPQASEVAAILDVPIAALLAPGLPVQEEWELPLPGERAGGVPVPNGVPAAPHSSAGVEPAGVPRKQTRTVHYFPWGQDKIWGATARMIAHLLEAVRTGRLVL
ncbi:MAG: CoA pyrophosphatase [Chloroflexi bacterium]|nr:CoA pyrophosphatase [Chloroflexota bacterium]